MTHYVVTPDGAVRKYTAKSVAMAMIAQLGTAYYATDNDFKAIPSPVLVTLHNVIRPEKPVTRFSDRATAEKRLTGVLEVLAKPGEAPTTVEGATKDDTTAQGSDSTSADADALPEFTEEEEKEQATLDELPLTPEEFTPDSTKSDQENEEMATAAKNTRNANRRTAAKKAKKSAAKKGTKGTKRAPVLSIPESTVRRVIKMREDGKGWPEILKALGEKSNNFIHRIRPLMKKLDKSSVKQLGPGSPNYGKGKAKKGGKK